MKLGECFIWMDRSYYPPSLLHPHTSPYKIHTQATKLTFCQLLCLISKYVRLGEFFLRMDRSYYPPSPTHPYRIHTPATKLTFCQLLCLRSRHVRLGECFLKMDRSSRVLVRSFQLRSKVFSFDIPCNIQKELKYVRALITLLYSIDNFKLSLPIKSFSVQIKVCTKHGLQC